MNSHNATARSTQCVGSGTDLSLVGSQPPDAPGVRFENEVERRWEQPRTARGSSASQLPGPAEVPVKDHHADLTARASHEPLDVTVQDSDLEQLGTHGTDLPSVSVIIPAYTMSRWDSLSETVASAQVQTVPVLETIVVIDHHPELLDRAKRELPGVRTIPSEGSPGASGARNTGVAASRGEIVAFLDDDAMATPDWLANLLCHFADPDVVGAGAYITPLWETARPSWLPPEFDWAIGTSYLGLPERAAAVRNVWTNSMVIRRRAFEAAGGFRDDFGKVGIRCRPEDTDLCLRVASARERGIWIYDPAGVINHRVPAKRTTWSYFIMRCFDEGWGKGVLASLDGNGESTSLERLYVRRVLPAGIGRGLRETACGNASGMLRSIVIAVGLCVAVVGYLACRCMPTRPYRNRRIRSAR
jgi:GT2 family glycosyltransferase